MRTRADARGRLLLFVVIAVTMISGALLLRGWHAGLFTSFGVILAGGVLIGLSHLGARRRRKDQAREVR